MDNGHRIVVVPCHGKKNFQKELSEQLSEMLVWI